MLRPGPLVTLHPWCLGRCGALTQARPGALGHVPSPPSQAVSVSPSLPNRKMATNFLVHEKIWFDKFKYDDAERQFYERMNGPVAGSSRQVGAALGAPGTMPTRGGGGQRHVRPQRLCSRRWWWGLCGCVPGSARDGTGHLRRVRPAGTPVPIRTGCGPRGRCHSSLPSH